MRVVGLFAGIGGLELGLSRAGHETTLLCEIAPAARIVLDARFPDICKHDDIAELDALPGDTEIVAAGFPCQDLSQAGLTQGIGGERSGLVSEVFRLIDDQNTPLVLLENVSFMLQLDRGRAIATLVDAFESRGYRWAYRVINSLSFLPQRRERVYFIASRCDIDPAAVLFADDVTPPLPETDLDTHAHGFYWTEGVRGLGWAPDAVPTLKNGSTIGIPSPPAVLLPSGDVIKPDIRDAERLQGFPEDWTIAANANGRTSRRWALVGNAVTVPVAEWVGARIACHTAYHTDRDRAGAWKSWPRAARGSRSGRVRVEVGGYPAFVPREPLHNFLRHSGEPLSARATRGFLRRTDAGNLRFRAGFRERVRRHLEVMERAGIAAE
ncbi:DNA cytosine methyltransferase [Amaricoccus sp.]|uniref:DNA cytosine methyltransferase n=1 Tax=Amaricoccus sp. TaxID=1872485 RepID=UPI0025BFF4A0|nr:DNA (cytosine-5-)-methyltransferase [Amaricoccus sp.]